MRCKILMKALWLGRLARPDIVKPINDLATKVQSWSRADDKRVLRLNSVHSFDPALPVGRYHSGQA